VSLKRIIRYPIVVNVVRVLILPSVFTFNYSLVVKSTGYCIFLAAILVCAIGVFLNVVQPLIALSVAPSPVRFLHLVDLCTFWVASDRGYSLGFRKVGLRFY
jgi:hypothetical protein